MRVAPFKAQNMALNSAVTADGAEIGRAQAMQAAAAGVEPEAAMNPVLLKPGSETRSQVVLLGQPVAEAGALDYQELKPALEEAVAASLADLRRRFDVVICEGAGSPAEINLRHRDIANMGLARAAGLPVIVVGDIDRGGVLAALYGTLAVLEPADQRHIAGFVVNKFRGDLRLLAPGLDMLKSMTGRPTLGVLPWRKDLWLDAEDSLDLDSRPRAALPPHGAASLRIAVVRLPRMSNVTDVDPLAAEPGVVVDLATTPAQLDGADLVILPGTRATVSDLGWLREAGLAAAIAERAARGRPVLGICGGYQMLARSIRRRRGKPRRHGAGARPAARHRSRFACRQDPHPAVRDRARRARRRLRDPPRDRHRRRRRARSSTAARRARSAAPPGTASSRTTPSGARSCATWPPAPGATSPPRRT